MPDSIQLLGSTRDDAVGEAYDKVARVLGLDYPGGPAIDQLAAQGNPQAVHFKRSLLEDAEFDFSFSGLKTGVINYLHRQNQSGEAAAISTADLAASFQAAAMEVLIKKTLSALERFELNTLIIGGGVAANSYLRRNLKEQVKAAGKTFLMPSPPLCTDNAAMIALTGRLDYLRDGQSSGLSFDAHSRLPLA
jgi:N6-L-threonylcarbamoyladenine synthase